MTTYSTEQEAFWAGQFGGDWTGRNHNPALYAANFSFFAKVLGRLSKVRSVLELGANRGQNLEVLRTLLPGADLAGLEINPEAADLLEKSGFKTYRGSVLDFEIDQPRDLVFTRALLIHIPPDALAKAYDVLHRCTSRYLLIAEYYSHDPVEVTYRGHQSILFKRDFAGELMQRHPDMKLVDYGFLYRHDPAFPQDDVNWFLMEKREPTP